MKNDFWTMTIFSVAPFIRMGLTILFFQAIWQEWSFEKCAIIALIVDHAMQDGAQKFVNYKFVKSNVISQADPNKKP